MHISYKGDYALKATLELALVFPEEVLTLNELARRLDIPFKFLEQILLDLKRAGFVESRRGIRGGYRLAKQPSEINVGEVVRFIEGPVEPIACAQKESAYKGCRDIHSCVLREIWIRVAEATHEIIDSVTFEELVNKIKGQKKEPVANYNI